MMYNTYTSIIIIEVEPKQRIITNSVTAEQKTISNDKKSNGEERMDEYIYSI